MFNLSDEAWGDYPETAAPILPSRAAITAGLTPAQAAAAAHDGAILVLAGAGTGKTLTAGVALRIAEQGIQGTGVPPSVPARMGPGHVSPVLLETSMRNAGSRMWPSRAAWSGSASATSNIAAAIPGLRRSWLTSQRSTMSRAGSARSGLMAAVLVASGGTTWRTSMFGTELKAFSSAACSPSCSAGCSW